MEARASPPALDTESSQPHGRGRPRLHRNCL